MSTLTVTTRLIPTQSTRARNKKRLCRLGVEGVLVAKKDYNAPKHEELDVPNLEVIKAMQSLTSKGLVKTQFSWQWYYYTLTAEVRTNPTTPNATDEAQGLDMG